MKKILVLLTSILVISCTSRGELVNRAYLKIDRSDGISKQEAVAIAEYYFNYKQSAFDGLTNKPTLAGSTSRPGKVYVDRNPEELKDNWKFRIVSTRPNVDVYVSYLVNRKDGQIEEINNKPIK